MNAIPNPDSIQMLISSWPCLPQYCTSLSIAPALLEKAIHLPSSLLLLADMKMLTICLLFSQCSCALCLSNCHPFSPVPCSLSLPRVPAQGDPFAAVYFVQVEQAVHGLHSFTCYLVARGLFYWPLDRWSMTVMFSPGFSWHNLTPGWSLTTSSFSCVSVCIQSPVLSWAMWRHTGLFLWSSKILIFSFQLKLQLPIHIQSMVILFKKEKRKGGKSWVSACTRQEDFHQQHRCAQQ